MQKMTFDIRPFTMTPLTVDANLRTSRGTGAGQSSDTSRVGHSLFQLWNQFQAQLKGMVDHEYVAAINGAAAKHLSGNGDPKDFKFDSRPYLSKPVADPGVDRQELMAALRDVKANMSKTDLDPETRMELVSYAQALLDGLSGTNKPTVELASMTRWLLTGLGFKGDGLF